MRRFDVAYRELSAVDTTSEPERSSPVQLSYVGVLRSGPLPVLYGALCFVTGGVALASFRVELAALAFVTSVTALAYLSFVGRRITVRVARVAGVYAVTVRTLFRSRTWTTKALPRLVSREHVAALGKHRLGAQLELSFHLGQTTLVLPCLHVGATVTDTEARLQAFREGLLALAESHDEAESEDSPRGSRRWELPEVPAPTGGTLDSVRWAKGPPLRDDLRRGVSSGVLEHHREALVVWMVACAVVISSTLVPSSLSLAHRGTVAGTALTLALWIGALVTYRRSIRLAPATAREPARVVLESRILGLRSTRSVPVGEGLRMVLTTCTSEESNHSATAFLVERSGVLHRVAEAPERSQLTPIESFGVALVEPNLVEAALEPRTASADRTNVEPDAASPPMRTLAPPRGLPRGLALLAVSGAVLLGLATCLTARDMVLLRSAAEWRRTTCAFEAVRSGKSSQMHAHPAIAPSVSVAVSLGTYMTDAECWVVDDVHGYDILRFSPPSGPPTSWEKLHDSTKISFAFLWTSALVLAGPWLRRRRAFDVRTG